MELTTHKQKTRSAKLTFTLFYFFIFFGLGSLFPLLAVYLNDTVGLTGAQIGTIMSISPVVTILTQPVWGLISDYTQKPKLVLTITLICTALIGVGYSFVESYFWFIIFAALLAVTQSAVVPISDSMALSYVQKTKGNYGSIRLWGALGFAVAVLIVGNLSETFSLSIIFYVFVIMLFVSSVFAWSLPDEGNSMQINIKTGVSRLVKMPRFLLFLLTTFLIFGPILSNNFYFGLYIRELGGTLTGVGIAFMLGAGSEAPFMKFAGKWIQKIGMLQVLILAGLISGLRWILYFFDPPLYLVFATIVAQGFSVGLYIPAALQYVRDISPGEVRVTAVSLYSAVGNGLGTWFCTFVGGFILEAFSINHLYLFYGLLTSIGLMLVLVIVYLEKKTTTATMI
ncbi:MFS transporter [Bacillus luteolus]|uniref:MFS transporter n=1 Tax=Litchfieldia luteola TaxID=682179 RepID=A0ABR9QIK9_9BACI|nr:MFS transporter [Cytobacillus luteolus]MBE4908327.1 MFS transporter [Cytobacillus luteolus]MBP1943115.1 PPP family 3-phenylpropionic acid transporter [Cytobacillus luteolus]